MKKILFTVLLITAIHLPILIKADDVYVKSGTIIQLELSQPVISKNNLAQTSVDLRVKYDVVIKDKVIARAGSLAKAQVTFSQRAKGCGKAGSIEIQAISLQAVDGQNIALISSKVKRDGEDKKTLAWALSIGGCFLISPVSFLFLLIKGNEAEIPAGTLVDSQTLGNFTIRVE
jgi:hypothetical protein